MEQLRQERESGGVRAEGNDGELNLKHKLELKLFVVFPTNRKHRVQLFHVSKQNCCCEIFTSITGNVVCVNYVKPSCVRISE